MYCMYLYLTGRRNINETLTATPFISEFVYKPEKDKSKILLK